LPRAARTYCLNIAAGLILLSAAVVARAEDPDPMQQLKSLLPMSEQALYKGFVGNLLEEVPIEPEHRVTLQRGNAVVGNAMSGRSLATFIGFASPPLMIAGLLWGLWAAMHIGTDPESIAKRKENEDRLAGKDNLRKSADSSASGDAIDSPCSSIVSAAAECDRLADLFQSLPAKRGRSAEQARRDAAHAHLDPSLMDVRVMPVLEASLEQPSSIR